MTTPHLRKSIGPSPVRRGFLLTVLAFALTWLTLPPQARAVCQQGCDLTNANTFLGDDALLSNTTGIRNTANGSGALEFNTTGNNNTADGYQALFNNNADNNTANGFQALFSDTTGSSNTADGDYALYNNTTGGANTAYGESALFNNTTAGSNTANGYAALTANTTGSDNTANGFAALVANTTGSSNIALGFNAGSNLTTGNSNIDIGSLGVAGESKTIRIGTATQRKTFIAGISGATVASGVGVIVGSNGQLGRVVSSARFKDAVKPMDKASEAILSLQPVTFHYKKDLDPEGIPQFGLVAEQVEKVNPDLVARDEQGKPYTVRYEAVNAMLLNEFLKEHKAFLEEHRTVEELKKQVAALTMGLQKVSAELEASKPAPQVVNNP